MSKRKPDTTLDTRFSSAGAAQTPWKEGRDLLSSAQVYWLTTVRPDGRPHVTPLIAIWLDDAIHFCTGPTERKAKNLAHNPHCIITTGCNSLDEGLDLIVEGEAEQVGDEASLQRLAEQYAEKYGWQFTVRDGVFHNEEGGEALAFKVAPRTAFGFGKGEQFSQTRWRFV